MGSRPSQFKKGGGFLDGVDGTITGYQFTDEFNGEAWEPGKITLSDGKKIDRPHSVNCLLSVRVDGADEDTTTNLKVAGNYDLFEISDDGHVLTLVDGGPCSLNVNSGMAKFVHSLCNPTGGGDGFPDTLFSDDPDSIDFTPMIGTRVRLVQRTDAARTKEHGARRSKDGKREFPRQDLVVEQVYDLPSSKPAGKQAKATASKQDAKKVTATKATKLNGKAEVAEGEVPSLAASTLLEIIARAKGPITKQKLSMGTLQVLKQNDKREDVRKWLYVDENLDGLVEEGLISYDRDTGVIAAV